MFDSKRVQLVTTLMILGGTACADDAIDPMPDASVPSLCSYIQGKATIAMDRNRSLTQFHGAEPPVYKDPSDVMTPLTGTFQTDLTQPLTPFTPEHGNLITEELVNLTAGLGFTPASNVDSQLRDALVPALKNVKIGVPPTYGRDLGGGWQITGNVSVSATFPAALWITPVPLPVGARIVGLEARAIDNSSAGNGILIDLRREIGGGGSQNIGETLSVQTTGAYATTTQLFATPEVVVDDYQYFLQVQTPVSSDGTARTVAMMWVIVDLCGAPPA